MNPGEAAPRGGFDIGECGVGTQSELMRMNFTSTGKAGYV
jgi:hypothetical protein